MNSNYALFFLREQLRKLKKLDNLNERFGSERYKAKQRTKYKHMIGSLEFAIEVLESWKD
ncbi:hypothetical protein [Bacillus badius]|uniref:hypothetical protein n=1 Tax=Bacillus badius TaxID=1455 RepID=UPI0007B3D9B1|nr:hypothetical protein A3781_19800 [Bacillus badius]